MDADDNLEQENAKSPQKKSHPVSGIALDALTGLLGSYSAGGTKVRSKHLILMTNSLDFSQNSRPPIASIPLQPQQPTYSSSISTPVRSTTITQASTPSVETFQARLNKAEIVVEHLGSKANSKSSSATKKSPSILFKSTLKPYKYMYQTIYKRADGLLIVIESNDQTIVSSSFE